MKNLIPFLILILLFSCNSEQEDTIATSIGDNTTEVDTIIYNYEEHGEVKPRTSISTLKSNILVLNVENLIYVNISTVSPENTKLMINNELLDGDKGLFKIVPKELGTLTINAIAIVDGKQLLFGRQIINVVTPETTVSEIFELN